jgi:hypothetical protein
MPGPKANAVAAVSAMTDTNPIATTVFLIVVSPPRCRGL